MTVVTRGATSIPENKKTPRKGAPTPDRIKRPAPGAALHACGGHRPREPLKLGQKGPAEDGHAVFAGQVQKFFRPFNIFGMLAPGDIQIQGEHKSSHAILLRGGDHGRNIVLVPLLQDELDERLA